MLICPKITALVFLAYATPGLLILQPIFFF